MTQKDLRILVRQILNEAETIVPPKPGPLDSNTLKTLNSKIPDVKGRETAIDALKKGQPVTIASEGSAVEGELYSYFERIGDIIEELGKALELGGNDPDFAATMVLDYIKKTYQPNS